MACLEADGIEVRRLEDRERADEDRHVGAETHRLERIIRLQDGAMVAARRRSVNHVRGESRGGVGLPFATDKRIRNPKTTEFRLLIG